MPSAIVPPNPQVATLCLCPVTDTAASPSIMFGGGSQQDRTGTGIYGDLTTISMSILGTQRASFSATGLSLPNNLRITGNLGVGNSASATTPGNVVKKVQIFDAAGVSLGFIAVYDAIV